MVECGDPHYPAAMLSVDIPVHAHAHGPVDTEACVSLVRPLLLKVHVSGVFYNLHPCHHSLSGYHAMWLVQVVDRPMVRL